MSGLKVGARAGADRLLKPYLQPLESELLSVREDVVSLVVEIRDRLGAIEAHGRATTDEVRGVRGSGDLRLDHTNLRLHQILDEVGGVRDRMERLEQHFSTVEDRFALVEDRFALVEEALEARFRETLDQLTERFLRLEQHFSTVEDRFALVEGALEARFRETLDQLTERFLQLEQHFGTVEDRFARVEEHFVEREQRVYARLDATEALVVPYFEEHAQRQSELRRAMEEVLQGSKEQLEKLELLMMAQLEGLFGTVGSEASAVRGDVEELTRMIRMQGDAADQIAEVLGRSLTRLAAEVEALSATASTGAGSSH